MRSGIGLPREQAQLSAAVQAALNLPKGLKVYSPGEMVGLNQTDSRMWIDDKELYYVENLIRIGNGRYRALWDAGPPLFTAPPTKTIVSFAWFNIGFDYYCAVFYSDGTADQVDTAANIVTITSVLKTFYYGSGTPLPATCQAGTSTLLIANNNTPNDYWIWDGTLLYSAGTVGPVPTLTDSGAGYTSAPSVTAYGGTGSGAVFSSRISGGAVVAVDVTNPGTNYSPGDIVQLAFSGGGSDSSAILTALISGQSISSIVVSSGGSGYTSAPSVAITGGGGVGATAYAVLGTGGAADQVVEIVITDAGSSYISTPTVAFSGGGGSGAAGVAVLNPGSVTVINVVNGGTNFSGTPLLTIVGGGGTGALATANMSSGAISSVTITNAGTGYTSTPTVEVQTAVNNAAAATVSMMPFGVSGYAMEVFTGRVFVGPPSPAGPGHLPNGGSFFLSSPASFTDFSTSGGGLLFTTTDRFLRATYTNFRQSNGYLYPFGDSSISNISNVQTSGNPSSTTFTYQNIDPQIGSLWRDTCQDFSRTILFANPFGVYGLYGGAVTKVTQKIDRIFQNAHFPSAPFPTDGEPVYPSSAVANIYNNKCYVILMEISSILTGIPAKHLLIWNEHDWTLARITPDLTYIGTQEIASNLTAWGTDGKSIFPLFAQPSAMPKTLSSKMYGADSAFVTKQIDVAYLHAVDIAGTGVEFALTLESDLGSWLVPPDVGFKNWSTNYLDQTGVEPTAPPVPDAPLLAARGLDVIGQELGFTIVSTSDDFEVNLVMMATQPVAPVYG